MENCNIVTSLGQAAINRTRSIWTFSYPHQVVSDPSLVLDEKRAILAAWASDEHAVESLPTLRHLPGTPFPVTFSSIMSARKALDDLAAANDDEPPPPPRNLRRSRRVELREAA